jgi:hypothetical protein
VETINKDNGRFLCLKNKSQRISELETTEGIFVGAQISYAGEHCDTTLNFTEKAA